MSIIGDVAELKLMALMMELGYMACKPMTHHSRYDLIVDMDGCLIRIQVKSTNYKVKSKKDNAYVCHAYSQKKKNRYQTTEVDYMAIHVPDFDAWYIIPMEEIASENIKVYPHTPKSRGRFEKYRIQ